MTPDMAQSPLQLTPSTPRKPWRPQKVYVFLLRRMQDDPSVTVYTTLSRAQTYANDRIMDSMCYNDDIDVDISWVKDGSWGYVPQIVLRENGQPIPDEDYALYDMDDGWYVESALLDNDYWT